MHCLGIAVRERRLWNKTTQEVRFYLSSLPPDAALLAAAVRSHWQIENTLHALVGCHQLYRMPVASAKAMGLKTLPYLGAERVNLLKQEKTFKGSLLLKRYKAALDNEYLLKILAASQPQLPVASSSNLTKT